MAVKATFIKDGNEISDCYVNVAINEIIKDDTVVPTAYMQNFVALIHVQTGDANQPYTLQYREPMVFKLDTTAPTYKQVYDCIKLSPKFSNAINA